ncbi:hypothetical protein [Paenibacillus alkalitolerans]|uniref:hypothetical protein n=1 Tax=Paenibacillus alkalitolerans TaxID=2799335 RepID=UPI0018F5E213|nr:hypothetical protein [Paenibacillus alkalitolerans]
MVKMIGKSGKEYDVTISFVDKFSLEPLGDDPDEVFTKLPLERQVQFKALCLQAITGKVHVVKTGKQNE